MLPQQYCLRWRYHHSNLQTMFTQLLEREAFCDVTLACEGRTIKAHKIVLSACSTYFDTILSQYEEKDPILIMKDVKYVDIKCLVEFMYKGEINVDHCHLATLLKTAEELRIKGLAEVSWRDEDGGSDANMNGVHSALPHVSTVMESPKSEPPAKRKRGRPPIDDYDPNFPAPKISATTSNNEEGYSNDAMSSSDHDLPWEEENANADGDHTESDEHPVRVKSEHFLFQTNDDDGMEDDGSRHDMLHPMNNQNRSNNATKQSTTTSSTSSSSSLTAAIEKEWPDVIKMNDYLSTGRRQQFWEEPFTKRVMDAIKTKNLEMKIAAELLGVSYGTLYGRYRDAYGCLKHPYRIRDFWSEQGPTDILLKLKRKEITLYRAAEQLNVTPQTLSNYLISMSQMENNDSSMPGVQPHVGESYDEAESDDDSDQVAPPDTHIIKQHQPVAFRNNVKGGGVASIPATATSVTATAIATVANQSSTSTSSLPNCPDVTIIKKEKLDNVMGKMNNNSDHSNSRQSKGGADQQQASAK
ncbi:uncharacterized protein LOC108736351 [Agrilus planipennis]|uniref:Uncharacterized protein LOC108736351 n=1 Tax=Agrilus planipennis TaxID=224129 RepID=A0A1W4WUR9_AGRPL|nr:uncharacterized protein LOC108736351 [Agrilus planipennis]